MVNDTGFEEQTQADSAAVHHVRMPGYLIDEEIGLGDLIKRATSAVGIAACGGCARRAAALNRWLVISNRNNR